MLVMRIQRCGAVEVPLPQYQSRLAAGFDLHAALSDAVVLQPGERRYIPTGLRISLPEGTEAQVRPRSGLALKHGLTIVNAPGTVDADYRGEIGVVLINHGNEVVTIQPLDRVAQVVIARVEHVEFEEVAALDETERGTAGYGSTGV